MGSVSGLRFVCSEKSVWGVIVQNVIMMHSAITVLMSQPILNQPAGGKKGKNLGLVNLVVGVRASYSRVAMVALSHT